jgi:cell division protein FtsI (penicillin-binding protein 3)
MSTRRRGTEGVRPGRVLRFVRRPADLDPLQQSDRPDAAFEGLWRDGVKRRVVVVLSLLAFWAVGVEARLVHLQVFQHDAMLDRAVREGESVVHPVPVRGDIRDRNGDILAYSVPATALLANPSQIKNPAKTVTQICWALGDCSADDRATFLTTFSTPTKRYALVRRSDLVTPAQVDRLSQLRLDGISLLADTQRYYPKFELISHVIGFVGKDNVGLGGIEHAYDSIIRGQEGTVHVQVDARRQSMQTRVDEAPTQGAQIELTIDDRIQYIVERELAAGVAEHHANSGMALVMDPNTGEILALANVPTFNPNAYEKSSADDRRNRVLQDAYEPGSTMKIVTISAALEEGVVTPNDTYDTDPGYLQIGKRQIHDAEGKNNGVLSVIDIVVHSSNVGAGKIGLKLGADRLEQFVRRFGFGQRSMPDLKGETAGRVFSVAELNDSAVASMAIGYQISVTPIQMAAAASVVANGGTLYQPHLVRAITRDGVREVVEPKAVRRAISVQTATTMTGILEDVVKRGTGTNAALDGYTVAGKTGTAAKIVDRVYSTTAYNASFVGFVPSRHPAVTIIVVIDTPHTGGTHGGEVAAPVFKKIAEATMRQLGIPPTRVTTSVATSSAAAPAPVAVPKVAPAPMPSPIVLNRSQGTGPRMPDVRGLTAREALRAIDAVGLTVHLTGTGVVTTQVPQAGEPVEAGSVTTVQLGKAPIAVDPRLSAGGGVR